MCGICGWVDWGGGVDEGPVRRMCAALAHRGPDGEAVWADPHGVAVLGHRRLEVLDRSAAAAQPMIHPDGPVLVYNGEVYSFAELREELEGLGERVRSTGDTEVVLRALARWGTAALDRFAGMFALALWNPEARRFLLVRDRLGVKPLFWARVGEGLAFASELGALLEHPGVARRLDAGAVARWLQLGYSPAPGTLLEGVWRLPAGHLLEADAAGVRVRQWYDLAARVGAGATMPSDAADRLDERVLEAVQSRLVSDVPLGCFLSGGVDSSLVVAAAAAAGAPPEAVTVGFPDGVDESSVAARTAAAVGAPHRVECCAAAELLELAPRWAEVAADPLADPSLAPTWVVSRAARRSLTVALSGDGGDELFSGYPRLRLMPRLEPWLGRGAGLAAAIAPATTRWGGKLRAAVQTSSAAAAYQCLQGVWPAADVARLCRRAEAPPAWDNALLERVAGAPPWLRWRLLDLHTFLPERVLAKVDRASMDHSLEVRVPLLDHRVVELVLGLPPRLGRGKGLLREVLCRHLPGPQPPRRKRGFEAPLAAWLCGPLREPVGEAVTGEAAAGVGLDVNLLRTYWQEHQDGRADHAERLFAVAVLSWWARRWLG